MEQIVESVCWVRLISGAQQTKIKRKEEKSKSQKRQQKQKEQKDRGCFVSPCVQGERKTKEDSPRASGEQGRKRKKRG